MGLYGISSPMPYYSPNLTYARPNVPPYGMPQPYMRVPYGYPSALPASLIPSLQPQQAPMGILSSEPASLPEDSTQQSTIGAIKANMAKDPIKRGAVIGALILGGIFMISLNPLVILFNALLGALLGGGFMWLKSSTSAPAQEPSNPEA